MKEAIMSQKSKTIRAVVGIVLLVVVVGGGGLKSLSDWSTAEMAGYNWGVIIFLVFGVALTYQGFKK